MPPEQPQLLIAIDFALQDGKLVGREERVEPTAGTNIFASWYADVQPEGYHSVCGGLVYVRNSDISRTEVPRKSPPEVDGLYVWRDTNRKEGVMFAMALPDGYSLSDPDPLPLLVDRCLTHSLQVPGDLETANARMRSPVKSQSTLELFRFFFLRVGR